MSVSLRKQNGRNGHAAGALDLRIELLRSLTDLFAVDQNCTQEQIDHYENSFLRVSDYLDAATRLYIAQRIVHLAQTPESILDILSSGQDEAVHYTLRHAQCLAHSRMVAAAAWQSVPLAQCVAERKGLDEEIIRILAERPEADIVKTLLQNDDIQFDQATLKHIQRRARHDQHVATQLAQRIDDQDMLASLFLSVDSNKRRKLILNIRRKYLGQNLAQPPADDVIIAQLNALTDMITLSDALNTILVQALFCTPQEAAMIISDREGEPLALCGAWIGCEPQMIKPIIHHLMADHPNHREHCDYLLDIVRQVPFAVADDILRAMLRSPLRQRIISTSEMASAPSHQRQAQSWHIPARHKKKTEASQASVVSRK
jgi:Uncharacterised protein conserved in bacteria (DUF2336)